MTHITIEREALQTVLDTLEENHHLIEQCERSEYLALYDRQITVIKQALAAPAQSCYCPNCEALSKELAALKAQHEPDPCPGCNKGYVCRTPKCGRLKLPIDHPARTVIHPAHGITEKGQP
jgi:hypothetical protein